MFEQYHAKVPFVKQLMNSASNRAQERGQIRTLLGTIDVGFIYGSLINLVCIKHCLMKKHYRNTDQGLEERILTKHLNKLIQGSAADMTKKAMLDLYKEWYSSTYKFMMNFVYL